MWWRTYKILFSREHVGLYLDTSEWELIPAINIYFSSDSKKLEGMMVRIQWLCFAIAIAYEFKGGK